jgi:hypothetical protein
MLFPEVAALLFALLIGSQNALTIKAVVPATLFLFVFAIFQKQAAKAELANYFRVSAVNVK